MPTIVLATWIPAPVADCFTRSLDVDAHLATMEHTGERAVGGTTRGVMGPGDTVTWRARHLGRTWTMTSRISEHEAPHRFVDEQLRGPFARWCHEHRFLPADGGTTMIDTVRYDAPLGPLGRIAERVVLTRYLTGLLKRRNAWLREDLTAPPDRDPA